MLDGLTQEINSFMKMDWKDIQQYYQDLIDRELTEQSVDEWLRDWSRIVDLIFERYARLNVAFTLDTTNQQAEMRLNTFLEDIHSPSQAANQKLKEKLLAGGLEPQGFDIPLKKIRAEANIFREKNLHLLVEEKKLASEYNKIIGAQTVQWEGDELTIQQLRPILQSSDRTEREKLWRLASERQMCDRQEINDLWVKEVQLRVKLAKNAELADYRTYRWGQMTRIDYTPKDCLQFHKAIEQIAVPAATRIYEKYRQRMRVDLLRPWDLDQDLYPIDLTPLPSYGTIEELQSGAENIFTNVDPKLGEYFHLMREEKLLDLENKKGKAPGAYCINYPTSQRPFIFMNAVGLSTDIRTIIHESGHAFHNFERIKLPYSQQRVPGLEFAEVASMGMELLASPYLLIDRGGFYNETDAARFLVEQLERILVFWPYMAIVDAFQHWVYTHENVALNPANCDAKWYELWLRFIPGVDWSGLEAEAMTGWHRKQHIHRAPFYYVEYGLAQLGAVQVWHGALRNQKAAVERYLKSLQLGGTVNLPNLYRTAGAKFAFDRGTLNKAVKLVEQKIDELEIAD